MRGLSVARKSSERVKKMNEKGSKYSSTRYRTTNILFLRLRTGYCTTDTGLPANISHAGMFLLNHKLSSSISRHCLIGIWLIVTPFEARRSCKLPGYYQSYEFRKADQALRQIIDRIETSSPSVLRFFNLQSSNCLLYSM